jgi:putative endonuclease
MPREKRYYVYILSSKGRVLYVGMTGFLTARMLQHKARETVGFTRRYRVDRLVYYEVFRYVNNVIARESEIKAWRREKKVALIEANNPSWDDLAADWGQPVRMGTADSSRDESALRNDKGVRDWGFYKRSPFRTPSATVLLCAVALDEHSSSRRDPAHRQDARIPVD